MGNCYGGANNVPAGYGAPYAPGYGAGVVDADPITPGIQSNPGVVTPVGPPQVVGGTAPVPVAGTFAPPAYGGISAPYPGPVGVPVSGPTYGVPPVGVPQVGFQQTTVQTTTTAPAPFIPTGIRPSVAPIGGAFGAPVGGITAGYPGATFPRPSVGVPGVGGPFVPAPVGAQFGGVGFNRGLDMDPISPGVQTRPGVVTATGPSYRV